MEITEKAEKSLTVARILIVSMALGVIFIAVLMALTRSQPDAATSASTYWLVMAAAVPAYVVGYFFLRRYLLGKARAAAATAGPERSEQVAPLLFIQVLISGAMAEGIGVLGAVGYHKTGQPAMLLACFFAVLALVAMFPTRNTLLRFADAARYSG